MLGSEEPSFKGDSFLSSDALIFHRQVSFLIMMERQLCLQSFEEIFPRNGPRPHISGRNWLKGNAHTFIDGAISCVRTLEICDLALEDIVGGLLHKLICVIIPVET